MSKGKMYIVGRHQKLHAPRNLGEAVADRVTTFSGSWAFLGLHACWWGLWIGLRVEGFPFGLLTMLLSLEAIVLSTLVLMSQARESRKNQRRDDHEAETVDLGYVITREVHVMQGQQLRLLEDLHALRDELRCRQRVGRCTCGAPPAPLPAGLPIPRGVPVPFDGGTVHVETA